MTEMEKSGPPPTTAGRSIKDRHWQHGGSHKEFKPASLPSVSSDLIISDGHEKQLPLTGWILWHKTVPGEREYQRGSGETHRA